MKQERNDFTSRFCNFIICLYSSHSFFLFLLIQIEQAEQSSTKRKKLINHSENTMRNKRDENGELGIFMRLISHVSYFSDWMVKNPLHTCFQLIRLIHSAVMKTNSLSIAFFFSLFPHSTFHLRIDLHSNFIGIKTTSIWCIRNSRLGRKLKSNWVICWLVSWIVRYSLQWRSLKTEKSSVVRKLLQDCCL